MTHQEYIPWELIEGILSHVPPESLVRFKTVSKQWNDLFNNKSFLNNHKSTFRFILTTKSKIYSVNIDPEIVVRELKLNTGSIEPQVPKYLVECDEFLVCGLHQGAAVWNPWLPQARKFKLKSKLKVKAYRPTYSCHGIGYDRNRIDDESVNYKTIWSCQKKSWLIQPDHPWKIHDLASLAWKDVSDDDEIEEEEKEEEEEEISTPVSEGVALDGTLYWIAFYEDTDPLYHLVNFDFSKERFMVVCDLPCGKNHACDALVLGVFNGDQLCLLKQCHETKKIEIWMTKNKNTINNEDMVWVNFMIFSDPNLPSLVHRDDSQPSYFIDDDKSRLVVCSCDESGRACIYVMGENKLISKTKLDSEVDLWPLHCTHFPSLVSVPTKSKRRNRITTSLF